MKVTKTFRITNEAFSRMKELKDIDDYTTIVIYSGSCPIQPKEIQITYDLPERKIEISESELDKIFEMYHSDRAPMFTAREFFGVVKEKLFNKKENQNGVNEYLVSVYL